MDINQLLAQLTQGASAQTALNQQMATRNAQDTAEIQSLLTVSEQQAAAVAESAAGAAAQEAQISYKINKAKEANVAIAGMNPDDLNNQYVQSLAEYDAAEAERKQLRGKYDEAAQVGLLDNPVGYILNQLRLPQLAAANNAAVDRRDAAAGNVAARVNMIQQKNSIIAANTADQLLDLGLKKAQIAKQAGDAQLAQAKADNISKIGARALEGYRISQDAYRIQRETLQTELSIKQWQTSQQAAADARRERAEAAAERLAAKNAKQEEIDMLNSRLAAASAALGYQQAFTFTSLKLLPKQKQDMLIQAALSGDFGSNLQESLATMKAVGNPAVISQTNAGMGKFMTRADAGLRSYTDEATRQAQATGQKLKAGEAEQLGAQSYQVDLVNSATSFASKHSLNSKRWDDSGTFNPYKPEYLAILQAADAGQIPALANNSALKALKNMQGQLPPGATNFRGEDMERMVQVLARQVADRTLGVDTAAKDLANLHSFAAQFNKGLYNYTLFGLKDQTAAIVKVPGLAAFSDPQQLDLMNPASVKAALSKMASQSSGARNIGEFVRPVLLFGIDPEGKLPGMIERERAAAAANQPK